MFRTALASLLLVSSTAALAQAGGDMTPDTVDVVEAASATGRYETLLKSVGDAGLAQTLATTKNVTIFAPIDAAFTAEPVQAVVGDKAKLTRVLKTHVVPTAYLAKDIPAGSTQVRTLAGDMLTITNRNGSITVKAPGGEEAMVVQADLKADNGVVHGINKVLLPAG